MNKYSSPERLSINKHMAESDFPSAQEYVSSDSVITKEEKAKALALASGVKEEDLPFSIKHPGIYKALGAVGSGLAGYGVMKGVGHAIPSKWNGDDEINFANKALAETNKNLASSNPSQKAIGVIESLTETPEIMSALPIGLAKKVVTGTAIGGAGILAAIGVYAATKAYAKNKRKQIAENYDDMNNKSERKLGFSKLAANIDNISKRKTNVAKTNQDLYWKGTEGQTKQAANWLSALARLIERPGVTGDLVRWGTPAVVGTGTGIAENEFLKSNNPTMDPSTRRALAVAGGIGAGTIASPTGLLKIVRTMRNPLLTSSDTLKEITKQLAWKAAPTAAVAGGLAVNDLSNAARSFDEAAKNVSETTANTNRSMAPKISITRDDGKKVNITPITVYKAMEHQQFPKSEIEKRFSALNIDVPSEKDLNVNLEKPRKTFIKDLSDNVSNWNSMSRQGTPIDEITTGIRNLTTSEALGGVGDSASKAFKVVSDTGDWIKENKKPVLIGAGIIGGGLLLKTVYDSVQQHYKDERKRKLEELALSRAGIS